MNVYYGLTDLTVRANCINKWSVGVSSIWTVVLTRITSPSSVFTSQSAVVPLHSRSCAASWEFDYLCERGVSLCSLLPSAADRWPAPSVGLNVVTCTRPLYFPYSEGGVRWILYRIHSRQRRPEPFENNKLQEPPKGFAKPQNNEDMDVAFRVVSWRSIAQLVPLGNNVMRSHSFHARTQQMDSEFRGDAWGHEAHDCFLTQWRLRKVIHHSVTN